ncbi:MAG: 50S ribosomal protein L11 methyltransferase, partial [Hyphomicrobiales bacterium]|nr:50S ribosomal protein L11 methyltransferase [Hyphomicrobiales bacterium]
YAPGTDGFIVTPVPPTDWVASSQSRLHPVRAGRFLVHGSHDRTRIGHGRWAIEIDAGQAFGTAHHGSTRGCLEALDQLAKHEHFSHALDLGTGTGVLAIAAARAWRARVIASDIDPVAVKIASANARRNAASGLVSTLTATGLAHPLIRNRAPYGLLTANILARPLIVLAPQIARCVATRGFVVLSGITANQAARVAAAYRVAGFAHCRADQIGDWVTLTLRRR